MDRRERIDSLQDSLLAAFQGLQVGIWTAMPGIITNVDNLVSEQTVDVQPAIMGQFLNQQNLWDDVTMPICIHCPVQFPSGGGGALTFPVAVGDECLLVFASRCIDGWWQQGSVARQMDFRMHDLSDGFALLGFRSKPNRLVNISTTETQLRTEDGLTSISISPGVIKLKATNITLEGVVATVGNLSVTGTMTNAGTNIGRTHVHTNVQNGPNNTGGPV